MSGLNNVYGGDGVALVSAGEATEIDRLAREQGGIPERLLMENAGRAAAMLLAGLYPEGRVVAAVGRGHNGGDALVMLRVLAGWGREVGWIPAGDVAPDMVTALSHGHEIPRMDPNEAPGALASAAVLVDGLLGTGAAGAPRGPAAELIRQMNRSGQPILALDLPSGVDPTTGAVPGEAVQADATVCFGWPKTGLLLEPARRYCGRLVAVEIGFPPLPRDRGADAAELITPGWAAGRIGLRDPAAHKMSVGRVLVVAGRMGMAGAGALAARGATRAGAGLVQVASEGPNRTVLQSTVPEAIFVDRDDGKSLAESAAAAEALVVGPGIGVDDAAFGLLRDVLEAAPAVPALLDADALTLLGRGPGQLRAIASQRPLLLTPHPGEMARITRLSAEDIRSFPLKAVRDLAAETGAVVLLKGAPSVVAAPGMPVLVNSVGSSDLASAGMGDTLAGVVGAFLAGGSAPREAAGLGLFFTGRAADLCGLGRSLIPEDVAEALHEAFAFPGAVRPVCDYPFITFDQPMRR